MPIDRLRLLTILAALGWLAREDKLEFAASGRTVKVSLREPAGSLAHSDA